MSENQIWVQSASGNWKEVPWLRNVIFSSLMLIYGVVSLNPPKWKTLITLIRIMVFVCKCFWPFSFKLFSLHASTASNWSPPSLDRSSKICKVQTWLMSLCMEHRVLRLERVPSPANSSGGPGWWEWGALGSKGRSGCSTAGPLHFLAVARGCTQFSQQA